jgi:hypothetical protein
MEEYINPGTVLFISLFAQLPILGKTHCTKGELMSRTIGHITKGSIHQKVDAAANDLSKRAAFLAALEDWEQDYVDILVEHAGLTESEARHLRDKWYGPHGWLPQDPPIEEEIRKGLIRAIQKASDENLPIDSWWIAVGNHFEVFEVVSKQQVTRIILTPTARDDV